MASISEILLDESATIADRVFEELRQAIVEGEIPAGSKISEPEMAGRYGISRGPLREAMRRLESANLVERRPNVGARVITLTNEELLEIYLIREALEGMAARLAAERMSEPAIQELKELLVRHRHEVAREHGQAYFQKEGDMDFHYRIVQGTGNRRLTGILCNDLYHLARMYRCQFGMGSDRALDALKEHELVVEAIADRDGEMAEILMRRHIRASRRNVERRLETMKSASLQGTGKSGAETTQVSRRAPVAPGPGGQASSPLPAAAAAPAPTPTTHRPRRLGAPAIDHT
jgi:DNA-binding GntR family transcriptional regulator